MQNEHRFHMGVKWVSRVIVWEYNIWNPLRGSRRVALRVWTGLDKTGPSYVSTL